MQIQTDVYWLKAWCPSLCKYSWLLVMALLTKVLRTLFQNIFSNEIYQSPRRNKVWLPHFFETKQITDSYTSFISHAMSEIHAEGTMSRLCCRTAMLQWDSCYLRPNNSKWDFINSRHLAPTLHIPIDPQQWTQGNVHSPSAKLLAGTGQLIHPCYYNSSSERGCYGS